MKTTISPLARPARRQRSLWGALAKTAALAAALAWIAGCQPAPSAHSADDGHDHKQGDGHDHKEGDGHDHKEGDGHEHKD